jgi:hypothetical protein
MSGSRLRPYLGPFVALLVVLALGAGTVYAAIPNSNGKVYACYVKNTGAVRLINYPKVSTCPKGQKLINWNAKGPQGPAGPVGPAGPADWNAIGNKPAGFADGVDNVGTPGYVTATVPCDGAIAAGGEYIRFDNLPRNMVHDFQVVPTGGAGDWLYIQRVDTRDNGDGTLSVDVVINDFWDTGVQTCNVRRISFTDGISVAKAKMQLKKVEVSYHKKHSSE